MAKRYFKNKSKPKTQPRKSAIESNVPSNNRTLSQLDPSFVSSLSIDDQITLAQGGSIKLPPRSMSQMMETTILPDGREHSFIPGMQDKATQDFLDRERLMAFEKSIVDLKHKAIGENLTPIPGEQVIRRYTVPDLLPDAIAYNPHQGKKTSVEQIKADVDDYLYGNPEKNILPRNLDARLQTPYQGASQLTWRDYEARNPDGIGMAAFQMEGGTGGYAAPKISGLDYNAGYKKQYAGYSPEVQEIVGRNPLSYPPANSRYAGTGVMGFYRPVMGQEETIPGRWNDVGVVWRDEQVIPAPKKPVDYVWEDKVRRVNDANLAAFPQNRRVFGNLPFVTTGSTNLTDTAIGKVYRYLDGLPPSTPGAQLTDISAGAKPITIRSVLSDVNDLQQGGGGNVIDSYISNYGTTRNAMKENLPGTGDTLVNVNPGSSSPIPFTRQGWADYTGDDMILPPRESGKKTFLPNNPNSPNPPTRPLDSDYFPGYRATGSYGEVGLDGSYQFADVQPDSHYLESAPLWKMSQASGGVTLSPQEARVQRTIVRIPENNQVIRNERFTVARPNDLNAPVSNTQYSSPNFLTSRTRGVGDSQYRESNLIEAVDGSNVIGSYPSSPKMQRVRVGKDAKGNEVFERRPVLDEAGNQVYNTRPIVEGYEITGAGYNPTILTEGSKNYADIIPGYRNQYTGKPAIVGVNYSPEQAAILAAQQQALRDVAIAELTAGEVSDAAKLARAKAAEAGIDLSRTTDGFVRGEYNAMRQGNYGQSLMRSESPLQRQYARDVEVLTVPITNRQSRQTLAGNNINPKPPIQRQYSKLYTNPETTNIVRYGSQDFRVPTQERPPTLREQLALAQSGGKSTNLVPMPVPTPNQQAGIELGVLRMIAGDSINTPSGLSGLRVTSPEAVRSLRIVEDLGQGWLPPSSSINPEQTQAEMMRNLYASKMQYNPQGELVFNSSRNMYNVPSGAEVVVPGSNHHYNGFKARRVQQAPQSWTENFSSQASAIKDSLPSWVLPTATGIGLVGAGVGGGYALTRPSNEEEEYQYQRQQAMKQAYAQPQYAEYLRVM